MRRVLHEPFEGESTISENERSLRRKRKTRKGVIISLLIRLMKKSLCYALLFFYECKYMHGSINKYEMSLKVLITNY